MKMNTVNDGQSVHRYRPASVEKYLEVTNEFIVHILPANMPVLTQFLSGRGWPFAITQIVRQCIEDSDLQDKGSLS
jgi:hypothetical protein